MTWVIGKGTYKKQEKNSFAILPLASPPKMRLFPYNVIHVFPMCMKQILFILFSLMTYSLFV